MKRERVETILAIVGLVLLWVSAIVVGWHQYCMNCAGSAATVEPAVQKDVDERPAPEDVPPAVTPNAIDAPVMDLTFDEAVTKSEESGTPAVALLTAPWCAACRIFERDVLSALQQADEITLPLCKVDVDAQQDLANELLGTDRRIPQLRLFECHEGTVTPGERLVGPRSAEQVREFLNQDPRECAAEPVSACGSNVPGPSRGRRLREFMHR